jgi:DNA polymerase-1
VPTKAAPVLLLDTSSLFFRAYHALPPMTTRAGEPTSAIYGLSSLLLKLLREERPAGLVWAKDAKGKTFRHSSFPDYKAHRPPVPEGLRAQFARLDQLLTASGAPVFEAPGFEADDVLATLARELRDEGQRVRLVTGDRDLFQLATSDVDVLFVGHRGAEAKVYDAAAVEARFGVSPAQRPSFVALVGDPADNLPKVPGIGEATAAALIRRFGDIARLLEHLEEITQVRVRNALRAAAEQLLRTEELARLRDDVHLGPGPRFAPVLPAGEGRLRALFTELEFSSLLPRLEKLSQSEL